MRILFDQCVHDLRNVGNNAMLEVAMGRLGELWPNASFEVITLSSHILRLYYPNAISVNPNRGHADYKNHTRLDKIYQLMPKPILRLLLELREEAWHRRVGFLPGSAQDTTKTLSLSKKEFQESVGNESQAKKEIIGRNISDYSIFDGVDLLVATGGNYLSDTVKDGALRILDRLEMAIQQGIPTAMVGQGLGPIDDVELRARARDILPSVNFVFIRERLVAPGLLESFGVDPTRVFITGDDAIELAYNARNIQLGTAIGVNIRVANYTEVEDYHMQVIRETIQHAGERYKAQLVAIPISQSRAEADNRAILKLFVGYKNILQSWKKFESPLEIINKVKLCRIMITGGYHPAVFALAQGIPVVAMAKSAHYVNKLLGVADQFGTGCEVVFLDDKYFREKLANAIDNAWQSAEQVKPQLLNAAVDQIKQGRMAYNQLYDLVNSKNNQ